MACYNSEACLGEGDLNEDKYNLEGVVEILEKSLAIFNCLQDYWVREEYSCSVFALVKSG